MYVITDIALVTDGDKASLLCDYRDLMGEKWVINTIPHPIAQIVDTISAVMSLMLILGPPLFTGKILKRWRVWGTNSPALLFNTKVPLFLKKRLTL